MVCKSHKMWYHAMTSDKTVNSIEEWSRDHMSATSHAGSSQDTTLSLGSSHTMRQLGQRYTVQRDLQENHQTVNIHFWIPGKKIFGLKWNSRMLTNLILFAFFTAKCGRQTEHD